MTCPRKLESVRSMTVCWNQRNEAGVRGTDHPRDTEVRDPPGNAWVADDEPDESDETSGQ